MTVTLEKNNNLKMNYYSMTTKEGLKIYVINTGEKSNRGFVDIVVNYGGNNKEYIDRISGDKKIIPEGTAHLMEHLISNNGKSYKESMEDMDKMNLEFDAQTNGTKTRYFIKFKNDYIKAIEYLMNMVLIPKINDNILEKELGIVFSEMTAIPDHKRVSSILYENDCKNFSVIGTKEELYKVNAKLLNNIHANYYVPSNMAIIIKANDIPGNIFSNINKILENMDLKYQSKPIKAEKELVFSNNYEYYLDKNKIYYLFDMAFVYDNIEKAELNKIKVALDIFNILNFSKYSKFSQYIYQTDLSFTNLIYDSNIEEKYFTLTAYTECPKKLKQEIINLLNSLKTK